MITCKNGTVYKRTKDKKEWWYLRLYLVDDTAKDRKNKYKNRYIATGLLATKRNKAKANAMLFDEMQKYSAIGEKMPFDRYCQEWLSRKQIEVELTTYEGYAYKIKHIIDYFSSCGYTLGELEPQHIKDFYGYLLTKEKQAPAQREAKGLSNRTMKDIAVLLRSILDEAVDLEYIRHNPSAKIKTPKRPQAQAKRTYIGVDQVATFREAIKGHRLEIVFICTLFFGLRREEVLGLKWSSIRNGKLYIENTVARVKTTIEKDRTKTYASHRSYVIPSEIESLFDGLKANQERYKALYGKEYHESDYIFTWEDGRPYTPDYLTKSFKKIVRSNDGLDNSLRLHDLRASCVSILIHNGNDFKDVQTYVGHKDGQTTMNIYARSNEKQQIKVTKAMTDILFPCG